MNETILTGQEVPTITIPQTQVYMATHDGEGNRLPYRYRSFISFQFDDKWIEDFNFVAFIDGDRMQRNLTADFEDLTSSYDVLDGQFYHSTHFRTNTIHFVLMSDEIDGRLMENFKNWLSPGKTAELILSEYPNRAIMARVAQPPEMSMLPFEKKVEMNIAGVTYETSVTNFKGTVDVEFVMDDPFWYSIINIFGSVTKKNGQEVYANQWDGSENFFNDPDKLKDVLKIVYEDGIPLYHMIASPMLFGNDVYAASGGRLNSRIVEEIGQEEYEANQNVDGYFYYTKRTGDSTMQLLYYKGASIGNGTIEGAYMTTTETGNLQIVSGTENAVHLYYAGTAPAPIELKFTLDIQLNSNGYVNSIASDLIPINGKSYNTITFESISKQELHITAPNFITSYNRVIEILARPINNRSLEDLRGEIRDEVRHPLIRAYITQLINPFDTSWEALQEDANGQLYQPGIELTNEILSKAKNNFIKLFLNRHSLTIELNTKTGEATGTFQYDDLFSNNSLQIVENVGDMFDTNYLLLKDRNTFDENMLVNSWTEQHPDYSYKIYHDFSVPLSGVSIKYSNMYY